MHVATLKRVNDGTGGFRRAELAELLTKWSPTFKAVVKTRKASQVMEQASVDDEPQVDPKYL